MAKEITNEMITHLKNVYESNKDTLRDMEATLEEHGILNNGLTDLGESFEMGFNNALEHVFSTIGIDIESI